MVSRSVTVQRLSGVLHMASFEFCVVAIRRSSAPDGYCMQWLVFAFHYWISRALPLHRSLPLPKPRAT